VRPSRAPAGGFSKFSPGVQPRATGHDHTSPFTNGRGARQYAPEGSRINPPAQQESSLRDGNMSAGRPPRAPQGRFLFSGPIYWAAHSEPPQGASPNLARGFSLGQAGPWRTVFGGWPAGFARRPPTKNSFLARGENVGTPPRRGPVRRREVGPHGRAPALIVNR